MAVALLGRVVVLGETQSLPSLQCPSRVDYGFFNNHQSIRLVDLGGDARQEVTSPNFVDATQIAIPSVVHIKASSESKIKTNPRASTPLDQFLKEFFGEEFDRTPREHKSQPRQATGSGVIIEANGYIVTNYHVIDGAYQLEVTLNDNRRYTARLVGQDPSTDLALLKIEEKSLPYLRFGDSDTLQVGEWVLTVGNPFGFNSTVTKGIVCAKARNINILNNGDGNKMPIESFIQTDAVANPGSSGGALVNLRGELVGINTAIVTSGSAGTFGGYSFAVPSSIVKKTINDLKKYGVVQRAVLGILIRDVDASLAEEKGLKKLSGVYVSEVKENGAADAAGIRQGDVIVAMDGNSIKNTSQLQEQVAVHKPNDRVKISFYRGDQEKTAFVKLRSLEPQFVYKKDAEDAVEIGGNVFENIEQASQKPSKATGGVRLKILKEGPWKEAGMKQGFIITAIDRETIEHVDQFVNILKQKTGGILVEGFYQGGKKVYYGVDLTSDQ